MCPEEVAEDLEEVTVRTGLALVDVTVDVHGSQWGTLLRLRAALPSMPGVAGLGLDEDTAVHCYLDHTTVTGLGNAHQVASSGTPR